MSRTDVQKKLEDLHTLETQLWVEHRERQLFNLESFGPRDYDPEEDTIYSRAAKGLVGLLDALDDLLLECVDAESTAYATGQPWGESATIKISTVLAVLNEHLKEDV
jgi:hypothetical protein